MPVLEASGSFEKCLASVQALSPAADELIVVVDGAATEPARLARQVGATVLTTPMRMGPGPARNVGARAAHGDVLLFVDSDVTIRPDAIDHVRRLFEGESGSHVDAVIGSYDDEPGDGRFLSQWRNLLHHWVHQMSNEEASTFWGACGAVRRAAMLAVDGFDESINRPSIEDIELGYRLRAAGYRIVLCKQLQCKHYKRWTAAAVVRTDLFDRALPWTRLILNSGRMLNDLNLRWSNRASVAAVGVLVLAMVAGLAWPRLWLSPPFAGAVLAGGAVVLLLVLNGPFYLFLVRKRGVVFALRSLPWHWLHYLCGGVAFAYGLVMHVMRRRRTTAAPGRAGAGEAASS